MSYRAMVSPVTDGRLILWSPDGRDSGRQKVLQLFIYQKKISVRPSVRYFFETATTEPAHTNLV